MVRSLGLRGRNHADVWYRRLQQHIRPGAVNIDFGIVREFRVGEKFHLQFRADAFNATNTPHFSNPNGNVSNMVLNGDGTIKSLGGYTTISSTIGGFGREGIDQRQLQVGLKLKVLSARGLPAVDAPKARGFSAQTKYAN